MKVLFLWCRFECDLSFIIEKLSLLSSRAIYFERFLGNILSFLPFLTALFGDFLFYYAFCCFVIESKIWFMLKFPYVDETLSISDIFPFFIFNFDLLILVDVSTLDLYIYATFFFYRIFLFLLFLLLFLPILFFSFLLFFINSCLFVLTFVDEIIETEPVRLLVI